MRGDLLALDEAALAILANRGLVRRSARELARGRGPLVREDDDSTVIGHFDDGTRTVLPPGVPLEETSCTCGAPVVCRHRVGVVLAYRATATPETPSGPWSPGTFTDDELERVVGRRHLDTARRTRRVGYRAMVRRPSPGDPVPSVELSSCTVRFLVPGDLGYARVDAVQGTREDAVALAVWAFRAADDRDPRASVVDLMVGGPTLVPSTAGSGIEPALALLADVLADGVVHAGRSLGTSVTRVRRLLDAAGLRWPVDALDDLADQLAAYGSRHARYAPEAVAEVLAELVARHRCVAGGGSSPRSDVLGTEEAAQTPLRLVRLTGLGARVGDHGSGRTLEVYLAHREACLVVALRRHAETTEEGLPTGQELGRRRACGARLAALAAGETVTESAVRTANRMVRISQGRVARTTVTPSSGAWEGLPAGILVTDLDAERARLAHEPPRLVRPRRVADGLRAVAVEEVRNLTWLPGAQRLVATVRAPVGEVTVSVSHTAAAPGAVEALTEALGGEVRFLAGHLRRHAGELLLEPTAVAVGGRVVVPCFASAPGGMVPPGGVSVDDPLSAAITAALGVCGDVVHHGWRHLPPGWRDRAAHAARRLRGVGLEGCASAVVGLLTALDAAPDASAVLDRWADVYLRLVVTGERT